jgi:hypothetical protein
MDHNHTIDLRRRAPIEAVSVESDGYPFGMRLVAFLTLVTFVLTPYARVYAAEPEVLSSSEPVPTEVVEPSREVVDEPQNAPETVTFQEEPLAADETPVEPEQATTSEPVVEEERVVEPVSVPPVEVLPPDAGIEIPAQEPRPKNLDEFVFKTSDCVLVSDEEFYCVRAQSAPPQSLPSQPIRIFAQQDSDGDLEIYLQDDSLTIKLTDNIYDDDAPVFDPTTRRAAWHTLIDDRYQIFVYDAGVVRQVTHTTYNNTNPSIDGVRVAWQGWEDDNWEILSTLIPPLSDPFVVERHTRSPENDMFPQVSGGYVTWQSRVHDGWVTKGLNTETGVISDLGPGTGGAVESARLVLLVERRNDAGLIERIGYDVEQGTAIALGGDQPKPEPIPEVPPAHEEPVAPLASSTPKIAERPDDTGDEPLGGMLPELPLE